MTPPESIWKTFTRSGPWAILALILVLFYLYKVGPAIETISAQHNEMRAEDLASDASVKAVMEAVRDAMRQNNYLQLRNCLNTARNQGDRDGCSKGIQ